MEAFILSKGQAFKDLVANFFRLSPKEIEGQDNSSVVYYRSWILKRVYGIFEFSGVPSDWDMDYVLSSLFLSGGFCICDTKMGVLPLLSGLSGINVFNHPTTCVIANPVLGNFEKTIDKDCVYIKLQYNYYGIEPLIRRYSYLLASCDSALSVNLMNSKAAFIVETPNKQRAATMEKLFDKISEGSAAVFTKTMNEDESRITTIPVKQNFVSDLIVQTKRAIVNEFLTEIGIENYNMGKTARLNSEEVHGNDAEVVCAVQHWLDCISDGFNRANKMFGLNLSVRRREFVKFSDSFEGGDVSV